MQVEPVGRMRIYIDALIKFPIREMNKPTFKKLNGELNLQKA